MDPITIDGLNEDDFRCSIESMLRDGEADAAAAKLRALIEPYAGDAKTLPARLLSISPADFTFNGWDELGNRLGKYDRPGHWVSAIGVSVVDPREAEGLADASARLSPCIETAFYSDDAYPFSKSDRGDLLEGYTRQGAEWQGNFEQADMTLTVSGVEDLYEAVAQLEARLFASDAPDDEEIRAGSLCACYLSVLLHQAVRDKIRSVGLPRPLCVMTGCVGVYPFFDAPVMSSIECIDGGFLGMEELLPARKESRQAQASEEPDAADAGDAFGSLLSLTPRIARKKMVMELDAEESAAATRQFEMASAHQLAEAGDAAPKVPGPDFAAYAFDSLPEGALGPEDDDWADIPDGPPSAESQFDRQMDDWFGDLDKPGMPTHAAEEAEAFPSADVAGWNLDEPAAMDPAHDSGQIEELSFDHSATSADRAQDGGYSADEAVHTPHPDDSCYAPPEQPVGHGLRARLAHSLQVETPKPSRPFESLHRVIAWIRSKLS